MRNWRKSHELRGEARKRDSARHYARTYLVRGKLIKQPCEICGETKVEMHHEDYDKPLQVRWICVRHHKAITLGKLCLLKFHGELTAR